MSIFCHNTWRILVRLTHSLVLKYRLLKASLSQTSNNDYSSTPLFFLILRFVSSKCVRIKMQRLWQMYFVDATCASIANERIKEHFSWRRWRKPVTIQFLHSSLQVSIVQSINIRIKIPFLFSCKSSLSSNSLKLHRRFDL